MADGRHGTARDEHAATKDLLRISIDDSHKRTAER